MLTKEEKKDYSYYKQKEYILESEIDGQFDIQSNGDGTFSIWHDPDYCAAFNVIDDSIYTGTGKDFKTIEEAIEILEKHFPDLKLVIT